MTVSQHASTLVWLSSRCFLNELQNGWRIKEHTSILMGNLLQVLELKENHREQLFAILSAHVFISSDGTFYFHGEFILSPSSGRLVDLRSARVSVKHATDCSCPDPSHCHSQPTCSTNPHHSNLQWDACCGHFTLQQSSSHRCCCLR